MIQHFRIAGFTAQVIAHIFIAEYTNETSVDIKEEYRQKCI